MEFIPIFINAYIKKHLKNKPSENEKDLRKRLNSALVDYKKRIKCSCGNDIWVIGSASVGNSCFTCITGESYPTDDYEIEGFFDDDGYETNTDLIKKPSLCITCISNDNQKKEMLCDMTCYDQKDDKEFKFFAYEKRNI